MSKTLSYNKISVNYPRAYAGAKTRAHYASVFSRALFSYARMVGHCPLKLNQAQQPWRARHACVYAVAEAWFNFKGIHQPARVCVMCKVCVKIFIAPVYSRATLGAPFKSEPFWHVLVRSDRKTPRRRVGWFLVEFAENVDHSLGFVSKTQ